MGGSGAGRDGRSWAVRSGFAPPNHAEARASSRRPGNARPRGGPGAAFEATAGRRRKALPPGRRVVALGEADGMTDPSIPEVSPPGEGIRRGPPGRPRRALGTE